MITSIGQSIEALKEEYGLEKELVIEAMKDAVRAAARKQFKSEYKGGEGIQADWNDDEGIVEISALKTVVEEVESPTTEISLTEAIEETGDDEIELGDILAFPLPTEDLGRIAAQTAKQILVQKIREAVREKVYDEYVDRVGELINGLVKRFERGDIVVDLGNNLEAILPRREQTRGEIWNINERVRVVIVEVNKELRGQQIVVSRASSELLKRLFEMEVPEIYDDTVVIKSAVREPGDRAKIAVSSNEKDVDPVGACVGMKGSRVQSIIKELRGEKIDIIEWSDEPSVFAANALSPAKVSQVRITDINERKMEVIVVEDQLSLAIGKRGQNVRLATRLVGWDIDIISEEILKAEITKKMGQMMASGEAVPISELDGMSPAAAETLAAGGIEDIEALANTSVDEVVEILDTSLDEAQVILDSAKQVVQLKDLPQEDLEAVVSEADHELGISHEEGDGETAVEQTAEEAAEGSAEAETTEAVEEAVAESAEAEATEETAEEPVLEVAEEAVTEEVADEPAVAESAEEADEPVSEEGAAEPAEDQPETEAAEDSEAVVAEEASESEEAAAEAPSEEVEEPAEEVKASEQAAAIDAAVENQEEQAGDEEE
ncbi:MAG: transcription termination factor NusA [Acidobacteria bacterium]|nr:MAG: transcription termination factor NusA [Acidobacteriota bacterium]REK01856.1 MAG: transcription termination factor NusA [Acidobacteriota bacterium]REK14812.1 MAG: transcription termination factor NusA [Acidobacteriota bacterium]REK45527.1 MAG: transcription termination factor NusA [Acidobacteriota bacterium]